MKMMKAQEKVVSSNGIDFATAQRDMFKLMMAAIEEPEAGCCNNMGEFFFTKKWVVCFDISGEGF